MKSTHSPNLRDAIRQDFNDAIDRILAGKPVEKNLIEKARSGKLKLNVSTVAREAGRARSLIARSTGDYCDIRERIEREKETDCSATDAVTRLKGELKREELKNGALLSQNAALLARVHDLESRLRDAQARLRKVGTQAWG